MAAGSILLRADGSRVLLADGSLLLSDGSGDRCCCCPCSAGQFGASDCNEYATPDTIRIAKTGGTVGSAIELYDVDSTPFYATATSASVTGDAVWQGSDLWQVSLSIGWTYKDGSNNPYTPDPDYDLHNSRLDLYRTRIVDGFGYPISTGWDAYILGLRTAYPYSPVIAWHGYVNTQFDGACCQSRTLSRVEGVWSAGSAALTPCPEVGI